MNWNTIQQSLDPLIKTAQSYGKTVIEFAEKQALATPLFLKNQGEYDVFIQEKRSILIAYDTSDVVSAGAVRTYSGMWITQAFTDNALLRFISVNEYPELSKNIGISTPLEMRVYFMGREQFSFHDITSIKKWWEQRCYFADETNYKIIPPTETQIIPPIDPLSPQ